MTHLRERRPPHRSRRQFLGESGAWIGAAALSGGFPAGAARASGSWKIGCYTRPWDQFDYRVALDAIAEAGFRYAGLMTHKGKSWVIITVETEPEQAAAIGAEVRRRGLETISVYGGDFPVATSVQAGIAGLRRLIDNCAACQCPRLLLGGAAKEELVQPYYQVVAECCDYAASRRVALSVKPHGGSNATGGQCRKIVERVGHSNFRVWYDPGNIYYYSDGRIDPVDDVPSVDGLIAGMSIKDFAPPKEVMVTPGTGRVNFRAVLSRARKGGFTEGPLVIECLNRGDAAQVTAEARRCRRFLEELTAAEQGA